MSSGWCRNIKEQREEGEQFRHWVLRADEEDLQ